MGLADLHIHSTYSWDGTATVAAILKTAVARGLNVVAITDHDEISGALEALDLAPAYGLEVVPGIEVSTADGHLLALYLRRLIPAGLSLKETLHRIGEQGGVAVAAHPGAFGMESLSPHVIRCARREGDLARVLVGLEILNGSLIFRRRSSVVAQPLAQSLNMAQVGNSDAHSVALIGSGLTRFIGHTGADLRRALECSFTQAFAGQPSGALGVAADWLPRYLLRCAGWATTNADSEQPVRLSRLANGLSEARQA